MMIPKKGDIWENHVSGNHIEVTGTYEKDGTTWVTSISAFWSARFEDVTVERFVRENRRLLEGRENADAE